MAGTQLKPSPAPGLDRVERGGLQWGAVYHFSGRVKAGLESKVLCTSPSGQAIYSYEVRPGGNAGVCRLRL